MLLLIPFVLMLISLVTARFAVPDPEEYEIQGKDDSPVSEKFPPVFRAYMVFSFFATSGFAVFTLIAFHMKSGAIVPDAYIPAIYAGAMLVDGAAAVIIGRIYDSRGLRLILFMPLLTLPVVLLSFSSSVAFIVAGAALWGIVMGMHETIMKAAIADLTHISKRGTGYGIFNAVYGAALFAGGSIMGLLYSGAGYFAIAGFSVIMECAAVAVYYFLLRKYIQ
jgi:predicted MFS family arabinose efflux permease